MRHTGRTRQAITAGLCLGAAAALAPAQESYYDTPPQIRGLDVEEHIGRTLPMDLAFTDEAGKTVTLGEYFKNNTRPVTIMLVYYECPIVCDLLLTKQTEVFEKLDYTLGKDFQSLIFSFDPKETPERAAKAKKDHAVAYSRHADPGVSEGWRFHVGQDEANKQLAEALGFQYRELPDGNYSHPLAQFIITPDGKISRYLYGYPQDPKDLKLALMEASQGKLVKSIGERILAFCYLFDATQGKYTLQVIRVMQLGGVVTLLGVGTLVGVLIAGERLRRRRSPQNTTLSTADSAVTLG